MNTLSIPTTECIIARSLVSSDRADEADLEARLAELRGGRERFIQTSSDPAHDIVIDCVEKLIAQAETEIVVLWIEEEEYRAIAFTSAIDTQTRLVDAENRSAILRNLRRALNSTAQRLEAYHAQLAAKIATVKKLDAMIDAKLSAELA